MEASASEKFVVSLKKNLTADLFVSLESCLDCRQCGSACAWFLGTGDDKFHPKYKTDFIRNIYRNHLRISGRISRKLGKRPALSDSVLREHMPYYWKCTTCGRCTLACPLGLSNRALVRLARSAYTDSGLVEENPALKQVLDGSRDMRHSFGLSKEKVHLRLGFISECEDIDIPVDFPRCDYLYICAAVGNTRFPDYGIKVPKILNAAGVRYTFSSRIIDTGTDIEYVLAQGDLSRAMLCEIEEEADRLGAETILISECGCDIRTFYHDAGRILGRPLKFPVRSLDSLLIDLIRSGKLPVKKLAFNVTFHDSCKVSRLSGFADEGRNLLDLIVESRVEMTPNREYNYCCNGGTGPLRLPENNEVRRRVSRFKAEQIKQTGAERVVTPCSVCMLSLEDIAKEYRLSPGGRRMSFLLFEIVYDAMIAALSGPGELSLIKTPVAFLDQSPDSIRDFSLSSRVKKIATLPDYPALYAWLKDDPVVKRYVDANPGTAPVLESWMPERII